MVHNSEQEYIIKLRFYRQSAGSVAEALRASLAVAEDHCHDLPHHDSFFILEYFAGLDQIQQMFMQLDQPNGPPLTPEKLRFKVIQTHLFRRGQVVLRQVGGPSVLKAARPNFASLEQYPWWFLDTYLVQQRNKLLKLSLQGAGILAAVVLVLAIGFWLFVQPDQAQVAQTAAYYNAYSAIANEADYEAALAEIEQALAVLPNDPETLILKGIILERLGRDAQANDAFTAAQEALPEPEQVLYLHTRLLLELGQPDRALELARQMVTVAPDFPEGWLMLGLSYEDLNRIPEALQAMKEAERLAGVKNNGLMKIMIRVNMNNLTGQ